MDTLLQKGQSMNNNEKSKRNLKVRFYIISLTLLFVLAAIGTIDTQIFSNGKFIGICNILSNNIIPLIFIICAIISASLCFLIRFKFKGSLNPSYKVTSVKNENFEVMTFLATYIIPLACINLVETKYLIIFIILVVILGVFVTKMNLYMANPTLSLLGYKLYSITVDDPQITDNVFVITRDEINVDDKIEWLELDANRWFVRKER